MSSRCVHNTVSLASARNYHTSLYNVDASALSPAFSYTHMLSSLHGFLSPCAPLSLTNVSILPCRVQPCLGTLCFGAPGLAAAVSDAQ